MTNYFGKSRLIKLFYHYISGRSEYVKSFKTAVKEYGKDIMFEYRKHKGSEWLKANHDGFYFEFYATGEKAKVVIMEEKKDDGEKFVKLKRIVSYYTADFYPCSQNKDKSLDCSDIGKFSRNEERKETLIVDTETTGIYPDVDELLQVSIINQNGSVLFNEYFKPQNHIQWKDAEAINHITPEMVANCPCINERISALQAIFDSAKTIVGYNIDFDINFLLAVGIKIKSVRYIDVMRAFAPIYHIWDEKKQDWKSQKLTVCADYYGYDWGNTKAHNALGDCYATLFCYNKMSQIKSNINSIEENRNQNNANMKDKSEQNTTDEIEKWYPIKDYEDLYEISNKKRVRSLDRIDSRGRLHKGKLLKLQKKDWYGGTFVCLSKDGKQKALEVDWLFLNSVENKKQ